MSRTYLLMRCTAALLAVCLLLPASLVAAEDLNAKAIEKLAGNPGKMPFTFVLIGDPQGEYETFGKLLAQSAEVHPSFIIVLGDLTPRGGEEDYDAYVRAIGAAPAPVLSVIGNHDVPAGGRARYEARFGKPDRSFDYGGCRFILLDTADFQMSRSQAEWLERALDTPYRKFIATHCPPFLGNWWYQSFRNGSRRFLELAQTCKVRRVFMGHLHVVDSLFHEGVDYLVCGSGGIRPSLLPFGQSRTCFISVTVREDGEGVSLHPVR